MRENKTTLEKTTSRTSNIESTDLSFSNDLKGYFKAFNRVYNSLDELKQEYK